jgi:hypothetical protein
MAIMKETIWLVVMEDENIPIATKAAPSNTRPK